MAKEKLRNNFQVRLALEPKSYVTLQYKLKKLYLKPEVLILFVCFFFNQLYAY